VRLNQAVPGRRFAAALEAAVMRALARNPADRQQTVAQFAQEVVAGAAASADAPSSGGLLGTLKGLMGRRKER
jgi:hypothetical protein